MNALFLGRRLHGGKDGGSACGTRVAVDLCDQIAVEIDAVRLVELGARANLVSQLTGLSHAATARLYLQMNGHTSPSGQAPYHDTWYVQTAERMLQTSVIWRLYRHVESLGYSPARVLITTFEVYHSSVDTPLLDIGRIAFVPRLVAMDAWRECVCAQCASLYIAPVTDLHRLCPGCRLYSRYRCHQCGGALHAKSRGRPRAHCPQCGTRIHRCVQRPRAN